MRNDIRVLRDVPLVMRDGVTLYMDVYRPADDRAYPAIVNRTPYLKDRTDIRQGYAHIERFAAAGYNVVVQDMRGTGRSEGECDPVGAQDDDGYDTVEALAAMPWCDGQVGMYGESCNGFAQLACARAKPPHLKAICPFQTSWTKFPAVYDFGVFSPVLYVWIFGRCKERAQYYPDQYTKQALAAADALCDDLTRQASWRPLRDMPAAHVDGVPETRYLRDLMAHIADADYLRAIGRTEGFEAVEVPAMTLTGWFDFLRDKAIDNYVQFKRRGGSASCRDSARLIIGPWLHGSYLGSSADGFEFGPEASGDGFDVAGRLIAWYDLWTKNKQSAFMREKPIWLFVLGRNQWQAEDAWPLARAQNTPFYLDMPAQSADDGGLLTDTLPSRDGQDAFISDPDNPCPSSTGDKTRFVLQDQRVLEKRADVLVYTSAAFEQETVLIGPIGATIYAACDCADMDLVVKICLVTQEGASLPLGMRLVRARYRAGRTPVPLVPNQAERYDLLVANTALAVKPGQRIRVDVTGSLFPDADVNLHTGGRVGFEQEGLAARQTLYRGQTHPSCVVLPIIPQ